MSRNVQRATLLVVLVLFVGSLKAFAFPTPEEDGTSYFINEVHSNVLTCDANYDGTCEPLVNCGNVPNGCNFFVIVLMCQAHCLNNYGDTPDGDECFLGCIRTADNACLDPGTYCSW